MEQTPDNAMSTGDFKPNIYPIMYWALAYGVAGGIVLFLIALLSRYITVVWFPVFLGGLVWGGYRNYRKQKGEWAQTTGMSVPTQSPLNEFRAAVSDIADASRDVFAQEAQPEQPEPQGTPPENDDTTQLPPLPPQQPGV